MPLYDYQCAACGQVFETEHSMSARPKLKCPACGSLRTGKLFNAAGVQFKGSGFYVTDSRSTTGGSDSKPATGESSPTVATATPEAGPAAKPASEA